MPLRTHQDDQPSLNLTPMLDVVFLLNIFFMVGTQFAELDRRIGLQVPEVTDGGVLTPAPEKRVVCVFRDGSVTLDQDPVSLEELTKRLAAAHDQYADLGVLVRGDGQGPFQRVAETLNACRQAGIRELGISVRLVPPAP